MNDKKKIIWKDMIFKYFKLRSRLPPGVSEENHRNLSLRKWLQAEWSALDSWQGHMPFFLESQF
jgi:hypothetical protein